jgi:hypothetical protein
MGRSGYIALSMLGLVLWSWLAYFNAMSAVQSGISLPYALLSPTVLGPIALVPLALAQLWKLSTAERKDNILDPNFVLTASQSLVARGMSALMCGSFVAGGIWSLAGHPWQSGFPDSPVVGVLFIAIGAYGGAFALFSPRIRMGLSPDGFDYSLMKPARVLWHDITDVKLRSVFTASWIVLTFKDTTEFRSANPWARWRKVTKVTVNPLMFGIDPDVLKQGIDLRRNVSTFE